MYCSNCGTKLDDDSRFCPECGQIQELDSAEITVADNAQLQNCRESAGLKARLFQFAKSKNGRIIVCSAVALLLVAAVTVTVCVLCGKPTSDGQNNAVTDGFTVTSHADSNDSGDGVVAPGFPGDKPVILEKDNLLDSFSESELHEINIFLSNFSEVRFSGISPYEYDLLSFVFAHCKINRPGLISYRNGEACISQKDVDSITRRFFGKTIAAPEPSALYASPNGGADIRYANGEYKQAAVDGEFCGYVSVAGNLYDNNDGTYSVLFTIYSSYEDSLRRFYYMTMDEAAVCNELSFVQKGTAVVRPYTQSDGTASYQLMEYSVQ